MRRARWWAWLIFGMAAAVWGCDHGKEPPPRSNFGIEAGGRVLLPMPVPGRKADKSILAAAATAEEAARKPEADHETDLIQIDDSSPQTVVAAFIEIVNRGALEQLPALLVPQQQESAQRLIEVAGPVLSAIEALETAWSDKFPGDPFPIQTLSYPAIPGSTRLVLQGDVVNTDDDTAEATVAAEGASGTVKLIVRRIESAWRIEDPHLPSAGQLQQMGTILEIFTRLAEAIQGIAQQIESDQLTSATEAGGALDRAVQEILPALMAEMMNAVGEGMREASGRSGQASGEQQARPVGGDSPGPNAAEAQPSSDGEQAEDQPADADSPRQRQGRDAVDGTYVGPGQLRAR